MSKNKIQQLENIFSDSHICEIQAKFNKLECSAEKCDTCPLSLGDGICLKNTFELKWKLQKENHELRKNKTLIEIDKLTKANEEWNLANQKLINRIIELENELFDLKQKKKSNTELNPVITEEIALCRCGKRLEYEMSNGRVTFKRYNYCSNCGRKFEWDKAIEEFNLKYNK